MLPVRNDKSLPCFSVWNRKCANGDPDASALRLIKRGLSGKVLGQILPSTRDKIMRLGVEAEVECITTFALATRLIARRIAPSSIVLLAPWCRARQSLVNQKQGGLLVARKGFDGCACDDRMVESQPALYDKATRNQRLDHHVYCALRQQGLKPQAVLCYAGSDIIANKGVQRA